MLVMLHVMLFVLLCHTQILLSTYCVAGNNLSTDIILENSHHLSPGRVYILILMNSKQKTQSVNTLYITLKVVSVWFKKRGEEEEQGMELVGGQGQGRVAVWNMVSGQAPRVWWDLSKFLKAMSNLSYAIWEKTVPDRDTVVWGHVWLSTNCRVVEENRD